MLVLSGGTFLFAARRIVSITIPRTLAHDVGLIALLARLIHFFRIHIRFSESGQNFLFIFSGLVRIATRVKLESLSYVLN